MYLSLLWCLGHNRLKFFDNEYDTKIFKAIKGGVAVPERKFERPASNVDYTIAQLVKGKVAVILLEAVDSFLLEFDLHEVKSIAEHDHWYVFVHIGTEGFDSLLGKGIFPVTTGFHEQF